MSWKDLSATTLRHLPRYLVEAQRWDELAAFLCDLAFIEVKGAAGMVPELQTNYQTALK